MSGNYPDYETYRALYRKYYDGRDVGELLALLEPVKSARVLDLCCGEGQLTLGVFEQGAKSVVAVDAASSMISSDVWRDPRVKTLIEWVSNALIICLRNNEQFERVVCRQAVNYWLDDELVSRLASVMKSGGIFAFNTFNQKPDIQPRVLEYRLAGHAFVEVSWLVDDTVHHVQVRDGLEPHQTSFKWLSSVRLHEILEPYFTVTEHERGKTSLYQCIRK